MLSILGSAVLFSMATSSAPSSDWPNQMTRVPPSVFRKLPRPIASDLTRRGCTIPQTYLISLVPENVISGEFMGPGTHDWAVLCSRHGQSVIMVFAEGSARPVAELASRPDRDFLQSIGTSGQLAFSRLIGPITKHELAKGYAKGHREVDHDGIEDTFLEKASVVHFRVGHHWRDFPGGD
jgi:hypothetical protein